MDTVSSHPNTDNNESHYYFRKKTKTCSALHQKCLPFLISEHSVITAFSSSIKTGETSNTSFRITMRPVTADFPSCCLITLPVSYFSHSAGLFLRSMPAQIQYMEISTSVKNTLTTYLELLCFTLKYHAT